MRLDLSLFTSFGGQNSTLVMDVHPFQHLELDPLRHISSLPRISSASAAHQHHVEHTLVTVQYMRPGPKQNGHNHQEPNCAVPLVFDCDPYPDTVHVVCLVTLTHRPIPVCIPNEHGGLFITVNTCKYRLKYPFIPQKQVPLHQFLQISMSLCLSINIHDISI